MNYINFNYDYNNLLNYKTNKLCLDHMIYAFNDKYHNNLSQDLCYEYINIHYTENLNGIYHDIIHELYCLKRHGLKISIDKTIDKLLNKRKEKFKR